MVLAREKENKKEKETEIEKEEKIVQRLLSTVFFFLGLVQNNKTAVKN